MCSALQVGLDHMMVGGVEVLNLPLAGDGEWAEAAVAQGNENAEDLRRRFFVCKTHYPFRESMSWRSLTVALVRQGQTVRYVQSCLQIMQRGFVRICTENAVGMFMCLKCVCMRHKRTCSIRACHASR